MTEEEKIKLTASYDNFILKHKTWWNNRDINIPERRRIHRDLPDSIDKLIRTEELEYQLQNDFCKMIEARMNFYQLCKELGFTKIEPKKWIEYYIYREENGELKKYNISNS